MKRLLIVDDEPAVARVIHKVAEGCGYEVTVTTSSDEFMDQIVTVEPAVIIMDLSMPGADGVELLRFLSATKCAAKILIVSGFDPRVLETTGRLGTAMGLTICGTINKPVRVAELRATINDLDREPLL
jgi:CheY-like chemotaxis protein